MTDQPKKAFEWAAWDEVMRTVARMMEEHNFAIALQTVDRFLDPDLSVELRCSVLGMRAQLKEDLGDQEGAKADLVDAISLGAADVARYVNESSLAELFRREGNRPDSIKWYRVALSTAMRGGFPGGGALWKFITLQSEKALSEEDRALCIDVAECSWKLLDLPGKPNLDNLKASACTIIEREGASQANGPAD